MTMETHLMRDMPADDKPREKAIKYGIKTLTDTELMAIIFGTGTSGKSVLQLSSEIIQDNDRHLSKVARLSVADFLRKYKGIGKAKAIALLAALELGSRASADAATLCDPAIRTAADAVNIMRPHLDRLNHEEFWVIYMSQAGRVIREVNISRGGITMTAVDVKLILKYAIELYATTMIIFHNHPSGNLTPSTADDALTKKIVEAAKIMDIRVNDHIIIADNGYYSYHDSGRL